MLLTLFMMDASTWRPLMPAANIEVTVDSAQASEASAGRRAKLSSIVVANMNLTDENKIKSWGWMKEKYSAAAQSGRQVRPG